MAISSARRVVIAVTLYPLAHLGSEFMPPLREGSLMYMPNTLPERVTHAAAAAAPGAGQHPDDLPGGRSVWGKAGRANTATDWAPISMVETTVNLKPRTGVAAGDDPGRS